LKTLEAELATLTRHLPDRSLSLIVRTGITRFRQESALADVRRLSAVE